jgi:hypothetical protein
MSYFFGFGGSSSSTTSVSGSTGIGYMGPVISSSTNVSGLPTTGCSGPSFTTRTFPQPPLAITSTYFNSHKIEQADIVGLTGFSKPTPVSMDEEVVDEDQQPLCRPPTPIMRVASPLTMPVPVVVRLPIVSSSSTSEQSAQTTTPTSSIPSLTPETTVSWKGLAFKRVTDERLRQHVMRYFGAQHSVSEVFDNLNHLVASNHASIECADTGSFSFSGAQMCSRQYSDLNRLTSYLPEEWTKSMVKSMNTLFQSVGQLLSPQTEVASTQFVDVNVYQHTSNPNQLLVVHGSYSSEKPHTSRVAELLFGPSRPTVSLTAQIKVITLHPSFVKMALSNPALSLRRLQEAVSL